MSLYAIWDNLYSFLVKVNQNLKFPPLGGGFPSYHDVKTPPFPLSIPFQWTYNPAQNCWDISIQFSISRHGTIMSKTNKFAPSPPLVAEQLKRAFLVLPQTTL